MAHFSLPEEVLAELECSVCKVVQRDKAIFECQTGGHLYCGDCKTHLVSKTCPVCRSRLPNPERRNRAIERVISKMPGGGDQESAEKKDPPLAAATSPIPPAVASTANATGARPRLVAHRRARAAAAAAAVNAPPHLASSVSSVSPSKPYYFPRAPRTRPDGSESSTSGDGSLVEELEMEAAFIRPLGATRRQKTFEEQLKYAMSVSANEEEDLQLAIALSKSEVSESPQTMPETETETQGEAGTRVTSAWSAYCG